MMRTQAHVGICFTSGRSVPSGRAPQTDARHVEYPSACSWLSRRLATESGVELHSHPNRRVSRLDVYFEVGHERPHQRKSDCLTWIVRASLFPFSRVRHDQDELVVIDSASNADFSRRVHDRVRGRFVRRQHDSSR
jgi:hypothetical protein